MKAIDMRSLSQAARLERRVEVIRLRKAGGTHGGIAVQLGLSRNGRAGKSFCGDLAA